MPAPFVAEGQDILAEQINALVRALQDPSGGHSHRGYKQGNTGTQIEHEHLVGAGTNNHVQIDEHIDATVGIHGMPSRGGALSILTFQLVSVSMTGEISQNFNGHITPWSDDCGRNSVNSHVWRTMYIPGLTKIYFVHVTPISFYWNRSEFYPWSEMAEGGVSQPWIGDIVDKAGGIDANFRVNVNGADFHKFDYSPPHQDEHGVDANLTLKYYLWILGMA